MEQTIISSDSHVIEVPDLWEKGMPQALARPRAEGLLRRKARRLDVRRTGGHVAGRRRACLWPATAGRPGAFSQGRLLASEAGRLGSDRAPERHGNGRCFRRSALSELGPGPVLHQDAVFQEALFRTYNDWIIDYCSKVPDRLYGIGLISMYNVDHAIAEMRTLQESRHGRHDDLASAQTRSCPSRRSITSDSGPRLKTMRCRFTSIFSPGSATACTADRPRVSRAIVSVSNRPARSRTRCSKLSSPAFSSAIPKLKIVSVENEVGWMPFWIGQCDKGFKRHRHAEKLAIDKLPSEYFYRQIYSTFFNDHVGGKLFSWWGTDNCMWSNDYPHQNSTWPNSREVINRDMGHLPAGDRDKLLNANVTKTL